MSLHGEWRFAIDRQDEGLDGRWFDRVLADAVTLPGTLAAQGIGDDVDPATRWTGDIVDRSWFSAPAYARYRQPGNIKVPFWLQPRKYYAGAAWFQREVEIPSDWSDRHVTLFLERPHWETRVWLDGRSLGSCNALAAPHTYDLGLLAPGRHRLTIRVDNRLIVDLGVNSHSISDHTQGNWNGIVGRIELRATPPVWVDDLQVYPQMARKSVLVKGTLRNASGQPGAGEIRLLVWPGDARSQPAETVLSKVISVEWQEGAAFLAELPLGPDARLWDEFSPALYTLSATLAGAACEKRVTFGLREFGVQGTRFTINGRPTFVRGTLECCVFPQTGHPPMDAAPWRRILQVARSHGLNTLRFHSWCPPEAAFAAADELGVYLQVECSSWANQSTTLGDGRPVDAWVYQEADRILRSYGNHPSFVLMAYGNEPGGQNHATYLAQWVSHYRQRDPRRLYTGGAGWPQIPENQFHVTPDPRIQAWGQGLKSRINSLPPETRTDYTAYVAQREVPVISHEVGQWCVFPNFGEMAKYTGYLQPRNLEIFRERLLESGQSELASDFLLASGKLQTLCYKEDIESLLRTPGMGGFQLLDLHDFPGQGTALVGVLDAFWDGKGYVTAAEFRRFCDSTVLLARLDRRVFTTQDTLEADVEVAHYGAEPLSQREVSWKLVNDEHEAVAHGSVAAPLVAAGELRALGRIRIGLANVPAPARYQLAVEIPGTRFANHWDVWVYPATVDTQPPADVTLVSQLTEDAAERLAAGEKLLLLVPPDRVAPDPQRGPIALGFSSIFWNTAWTQGQPPHTLGILCDPRHPALADFPTDFHSNWQWWYVVHRAGALLLDSLPREVQPTVRVIDDWFTSRRLALLLEARVGPGKLVVCSIDLENDLATDPVRRQLRHSLLQYMAGPHFQPATALTVPQIRLLLSP